MIRTLPTTILLALSTSLLTGFAAAQTSTYCLPIGTNGAYGCQSMMAPTLTGGVVATGDIEFRYDAATGMLQVIVGNTSPQVQGETNPSITRVLFNFPAGAVSSAVLMSQTGMGGATPAFGLQFSASQSIMGACFGDFSAELSIQGIQGGIGNPNATTYPHPQTVIGPVTFGIQLAGPGVATLTANAIAMTGSANGNPSVPVNFKFQGGGINGIESGWVSTGQSNCCPGPAMVQSIGMGCAPQSVTIPTLTSIGMPNLGGPVGVDLQSPSTPNAFSLVAFGFSSTFNQVWNMPLPIALDPFGFIGCSLYTSSEFIVGVMTDGNGDATYSVNIPTLLKWCDREITFQAFLLAPSGELMTTGGLTNTIGS